MNDRQSLFASDQNDHLLSGIHSRGALPHLKRQDAIYFVTFRLYGTLPKEILFELQAEKRSLFPQHDLKKSLLSWHEQKVFFRWYSDRVDAYLDQGHGECWLNNPEIAPLVANALLFFEGTRYQLHAWVIMPNHVHSVFHPLQAWTLSNITKSWKGYTALQANRLLNRKGQHFWQEESHDHLCRDDEDLAHCCTYTIMNPVKAGLCRTPEEWRWSSAHRNARTK